MTQSTYHTRRTPGTRASETVFGENDQTLGYVWPNKFNSVWRARKFLQGNVTLHSTRDTAIDSLIKS